MERINPEGKVEKVKESLNKHVMCIGSKCVNTNELEAIEAVAMSVVAILSVTVGTIYGSLLF